MAILVRNEKKEHFTLSMLDKAYDVTWFICDTIIILFLHAHHLHDIYYTCFDDRCGNYVTQYLGDATCEQYMQATLTETV